MAALKFAHLVKEKTDAEVYSFYIDMRTAFKDYEKFYNRLMQEGTNFIRGRAAEVTDAVRQPGEEGKLIVQAKIPSLGCSAEFLSIWSFDDRDGATIRCQ